VVPSARLWATICLLALPTIAAGFIGGLWPLVVLIDVSLLVLTGVDWLVARRAAVKVVRELPHRFQVGVANKVSLDVLNSSGSRLHLALKDDAPESFGATPEHVAFALSGKSRIRIPYVCTPAARGRFEFTDLNVRVRGPLGLVWDERVIPARTAVSVYPDMRGASRLLLSDAALDFVNLGLRQLRRDGRGTEFARLRDYAQGDSVRDVDWKASARRGKPVTRVMESERSQTVFIGVDAGRSMAAHVDGLSKLDHAVNAALFLAFVAIRNGDRVGLIVFADGIKSFIAPAAGRAQYRKIVDALYASRPNLTYVDYLALFRELNVRLLRRSLLCIFTDFLDEDQASSMVGPMRRLAKRHVPVCLSIKDAALHRLLHTTPADTEVAFQHAVASELLLDREAAKRKVGQDGVTVIDVEADALSLAAVNKYLEIKSRGAL
jgi:uncharacterized protein (DUF58 family)